MAVNKVTHGGFVLLLLLLFSESDMLRAISVSIGFHTYSSLLYRHRNDNTMSLPLMDQVRNLPLCGLSSDP